MSARILSAAQTSTAICALQIAADVHLRDAIAAREAGATTSLIAEALTLQQQCLQLAAELGAPRDLAVLDQLLPAFLRLQAE